MPGLDRIEQEILDEARQKAAGIMEEARSEAENKLDMAQVKASALQREATEKAAAIQKASALKNESQTMICRKNALLKARQELIGEVLDTAYHKVLDQDDASYFSMLYTLLKSKVQTGSGELELSARDLSRLPADFESKIQEIASQAGGSLRLSEQPADIDGGFVLRYRSHIDEEDGGLSETGENGDGVAASQTALENGSNYGTNSSKYGTNSSKYGTNGSKYGTVEENCSIKTLFEEKQETLSDLIRQILFS